MSDRSRFWPLDFDQETEIYESPSWNLPGYRHKLGRRRQLERPKVIPQVPVSKA